jgi:N-terminal acetyltransferase B complex catalytic subunit
MGRVDTNENSGVQYGHVSAISVSPQHRRKGLAKTLMQVFEQECEKLGCYYVDLFVRPSNGVAVEMYEGFGYRIYRQVLGYYEGDVPEDGLGKQLII